MFDLEKFKLHDLKKNPSDIPLDGRQVLIYVETSKFKLIFPELGWFDEEADEWVHYNQKQPVIAWRELPGINEDKCKDSVIPVYPNVLLVNPDIDWSKFKWMDQYKEIDYSNPEKVFFNIYKQNGTLREEDTTMTEVAKPKEKRIELFDNDELTLEKRGNSYFLSFFDENGKFRREVIVRLYDDYKVTVSNCK